MAKRQKGLRKDGLVEYKANLGKLNGKIKWKSFYGKSLREAKDKAAEYIEKSKSETENQAKFNAWAVKWLELYKKPYVELNTYLYTYKAKVEKYLIPFFREAELNSIKPEDIQKFFNIYSDKSQSLLSDLKITLNNIFEKAIDNELCVKNPMRNIIVKGKETKERTFLSSEQFDSLMEYAKTHKFGLPVLIYLNTGIRRNELLGLRWSDVNFEESHISVKQAVKREKGNPHAGEPKTKSSVRIIPVSKEFTEYLNTVERKGNYVIPGGKHEFMTHGYIDRVFKKFITDVQNDMKDFPKITIHELRHSYATMLRNSGIDVYTIQKVLGHSDIKVTSDTYVHNDVATLRKHMKFDEPEE